MKTWKLFSILAFLASAIYFLHQGLERHRYTRAQQDFSFLPSTQQVRLMSLGHTETAASLLWVRGVLYFGSSLMEQKSTEWMEHLIDLVTTTDSQFKQAYHFLATAIQAENLSDRGIKIQEKGTKQFPEDWQLSLYYAMNKIDRDGDYEAASKVMEPFKNSTKVPTHITKISETFKRKSLPIKESLHLYLSEYSSQSDITLRENLKNKILYFLTNTMDRTIQQLFRREFQKFELKEINLNLLYTNLLNHYYQLGN